eukprot:gene11418-13307_t
MSNPPKEIVLPKEGQRNILITSALPYVNNVPHLGNIIGSVLSADVYSSIYISGTDEYGTATETRALAKNKTPREICDHYHTVHNEIYEWFNIGFDRFGRTSTQHQTEIAQDIFLKLHARGLTLTKDVEQLYCERCERYLADRHVHGVCPHCAYDDARGDQCDACIKLLNPTELLLPRCMVDNSTPVLKRTKHIFLDLRQTQARLGQFVDDRSAIWSANSVSITNSWLKQSELRPRCITRDLKWGTQVPLEEFSDRVFYVWFDAPIGYLSITKAYTDHWEQWWKNPDKVQLVQFMGKDNVPFHTVIFPSSLIGTGEQYTLLHNLSTTEYLKFENSKFSKSRGTGIFGDDARSSGIDADLWRFYLIYVRPETSDTVFSWDDFCLKTTELNNNFGNLVSRVLKLMNAILGGKTPAIELNDADRKYVKEVDVLYKEYLDALEKVHIKDGLRTALAISKHANQYFQENKPWELRNNGDIQRCGTVLTVALNTIKLLATVFEPFIPTITQSVHDQLNCQPTKYTESFVFLIEEGHEIAKDIEPLIKKIEDFSLDMRVAEIVGVESHPKLDSLYVVSVKCTGYPKDWTMLMKSTFDRKDLYNKRVVVLLYLKPVKHDGIACDGVILVASNGTEMSLVTSTKALGSRVNAKGSRLNPRSHLDYEKEFQCLAVTLTGNITYKGKDLFASNGESLLTTEKPLTFGNIIYRY